MFFFFNMTGTILAKHFTLASRLTIFKKKFEMILDNLKFSDSKHIVNKIGVQRHAREYILYVMHK